MAYTEEELDDLPVYKLEMPLGPETNSYIVVRGPLGVEECRRLKGVVDLLQDAVHGKVIEVPVALTPRTYGTGRRRRLLPPCELHPTSLRHPTTNRCVECEKLRAIERNKAKHRKEDVL